LDRIDSKRQLREKVIEELDGGFLIAFRVDTQNP